MRNGEGLGFTDRAWPDRRSGPYLLRAWWVAHDGRAECAGLAVWKGCRPGADGTLKPLRGATPAPLRAEDWRRIPVASVLNEMRREQAAVLRKAATSDDLETLRLAGEALGGAQGAQVAAFVAAFEDQAATFTGKVAGRYSDEHWQQVAAVYGSAWRRGENPTQAVAAYFKQPASTAAKHVARARDLGLLERLGRGRAGGIVTKSSRKGSK